MQIEKSFKIRGLAPLLMHNGRLADPLNEHSKNMKEISGKRKKTEEDYKRLADVEWTGSLYVNEDGKLIIPSLLLQACIYEGAKKQKLGTAFKSSVFVEDDAILDIGTRKTIEDLREDQNYRDVRGVKIGKVRVMRTRPRFNQWECAFTVMYEDEQVNESDVDRSLCDAGKMVGLGDYRPNFGRFEVIG